MSDGVVALDSQLRVITYNGAALDVLNLNATIAEQHITDVFKPTDERNQPVDIANLIHQTTTSKSFRNFKLAYTDGSETRLFMSIAPVRAGFGAPGTQGYVLILRDITHEKSLEDERNEFISVVSHELRTPIAIAEGNVSNAIITAQKSGDMAIITKALDEAHDQIMFLADMINDLATLSRAESNKLKTEIEEISISELLKDLGDLYHKEATDKGISLIVDPTNDDIRVRSSALYVREILQNLITNAIKYTDTGSVTVSARAVPDGVALRVQDTGIGISKADQERIFDKFFRSEDFRTRKYKGTGLGLYVTMKLMHLIHADIEIQSELNKGSTFTVTFPNLL